MKKAVRTLAVAAATMLALAGCSGSPQNAAVVDGQAITEAQVEEANQAFVALGADPRQNRQTIAGVMVRGVLSERVAEANSIQITDADRAQALAAVPSMQRVAEQPGGRGVVDDYLDTAILLDRIGEAGYFEQAGAFEVQLNPRYGTWVPSALNVGGSGSLSRAVEEA
jgi:hypothetical protein